MTSTPSPFQTEVCGVASAKRRGEERSACDALMQQDCGRVRALGGGGGGRGKGGARRLRAAGSRVRVHAYTL